MSASIQTISATKLTDPDPAGGGKYKVRLKGKLTLSADETSWVAGFDYWNNVNVHKSVVTVAPGTSKTYTLDITVDCGFGYACKAVAERLSDHVHIYGNQIGWNVPCQ